MICNGVFVDRENKRLIFLGPDSAKHRRMCSRVFVWMVATFILIGFPGMVTVKIHKKTCSFVFQIGLHNQ